jgi:hypothetical protein
MMQLLLLAYRDAVDSPPRQLQQVPRRYIGVGATERWKGWFRRLRWLERARPHDHRLAKVEAIAREKQSAHRPAIGLRNCACPDAPFSAVVPRSAEGNPADIRSLHAKKYNESRGLWQARINDDWRFYFTIESDAYILHELHGAQNPNK